MTGMSQDLLQIESGSIETFLDITSSRGAGLVVDFLQEGLGFSGMISS